MLYFVIGDLKNGSPEGTVEVVRNERRIIPSIEWKRVTGEKERGGFGERLRVVF